MSSEHAIEAKNPSKLDWAMPRATPHPVRPIMFFAALAGVEIGRLPKFRKRFVDVS